MVWFFSVIGICLLFLCSYINYLQDKKTATIRSFLMDKSFRDMIIELIVVILGVTLAINFSDVLEKRETSAKMIELLKLGKTEVTGCYNLNESWLISYKEERASLEEVKQNAQASVKSLENMLNSEGVMISITPTTYVGLSNHIYIVNRFYSKLQNTQNDDKEIATDVAAIEGSLEAILFLIDNEVACLEGKQSEKETYLQYIRYYDEKYSDLK